MMNMRYMHIKGDRLNICLYGFSVLLFLTVLYSIWLILIKQRDSIFNLVPILIAVIPFFSTFYFDKYLHSRKAKVSYRIVGAIFAFFIPLCGYLWFVFFFWHQSGYAFVSILPMHYVIMFLYIVSGFIYTGNLRNCSSER